MLIAIQLFVVVSAISVVIMGSVYRSTNFFPCHVLSHFSDQNISLRRSLLCEIFCIESIFIKYLLYTISIPFCLDQCKNFIAWT